jgi:folate-binding protein YgfZ
VDAQPRALWVGSAGAQPPGAPLDPALWQWSEVRSGIATVTAAIVEAFVPQMLNYESVGGVNFKKGCYPGQEVVARSQFRGTLKRRAFVAHCDGELAAGQEVFQAAEPEQPAGLVAQAAPAPGGGWDAIVSLQLAAASAGDLHGGRADGPALQLLPLPYLLLSDV